MRSFWLSNWFLALVAVGVLLIPGRADAFLRVGVDARWIPLSMESSDFEQSPMRIDSGRQLNSLGFGARVLLGFDYFSIGPKVNFARHEFTDPELSFSQVDANGHLRMRIPAARLAVFVEGGPAISLAMGGVGYNGVLGVEVDALGWPLVDVNLGLALQYASVPVGSGPSTSRLTEGFRGMVVVGFDFTL